MNLKMLRNVSIGVLVVIVLMVISTYVYFSDARLKKIILPLASEAMGTEVTASSIRLSLFRHFPSATVDIEGLSLGETKDKPLQDMESMSIAIRLLPLLSNKLDVTRLQFDKPTLKYIVYPDSTTNLDPIYAAFSDTTAQVAKAEPWEIDLRRIVLNDAAVAYEHVPDELGVNIAALSLDATLQISEVISSTFTTRLSGLTVVHSGSPLLSDLSLGLEQESVIDLENETISIASGDLLLGDFRLGLTGTVSNWSSALWLDLALASSSSDFADLFNLLPADTRSKLDGYEAHGSFHVEGTVVGELSKGNLPEFNFNARIENGSLKDRQLPTAVEGLHLKFLATNKLVELSEFRATAGKNTVNGKGFIQNPLDSAEASLSMFLHADVDLGTVKDFYDVKKSGIEEMKGQLGMDADIEAYLSDLSDGRFDASFTVKDGYLKYAEVSRPFEGVHVDLRASKDRLVIKDLRAIAGPNKINVSGSVDEPLDTNRTAFDLKVDFFADLATIKEYYPISEDTLAMRGKVTVQGDLKGTLRDLEAISGKGKIELHDGYLAYKALGPKPLEDIRLTGSISNQRIHLEDATLRAGKNRLSATGTITHYMGKNPLSDITLRTTFDLSEARDFVPLDPQLRSMQGQAISNLTLKGPINSFEELHFVGSLDLIDVSIDHDSLPRPISGMQAKLNFTEQQARLNQMRFTMGASDVEITGSMSRYMALFSNEDDHAPAELVGSLKSHFLNLDELYPMTGSEDEVILDLPNLTSRLTAEIDSMVVFASPVTQLSTTVETTPKRIIMRNGSFNLFGGSIIGAFTFDVLNPRASLLDFAGQLKDVRIESFFRDFPVFGKQTRIHEYLSGGIDFDTNYKTALDVFLNPETATTQAEGSIGMTGVRLRNHPIQNTLADFLNIPELKDVGLNAWSTQYRIGKSLLTLQEMKISARDFRFELDGSENLVSQEIQYRVRISLPQKYTNMLTGILPGEAVKALVQPDSTIVLPLLISGTYTNPQVSIHQDAVKALVEEYLKRQVNTLEQEAIQRLQNLIRKKN